MMFTFFLLFLGSSVLISSCGKDNAGSVADPALNSRNPNATFKGVYTYTTEVVQPAPLYQEAITGNGHAATLGKSIYVAFMEVDESGTPPYPASGGGTFQSSTGNEFNTQFSGTVTPNGNGSQTVRLTHTVTDGIGRYQDVSGSFTSVSVADPSNAVNVISFSGVLGF
jgi:hypothetical protein